MWMGVFPHHGTPSETIGRIIVKSVECPWTYSFLSSKPSSRLIEPNNFGGNLQYLSRIWTCTFSGISKIPSQCKLSSARRGITHYLMKILFLLTPLEIMGSCGILLKTFDPLYMWLHIPNMRLHVHIPNTWMHFPYKLLKLTRYIAKIISL